MAYTSAWVLGDAVYGNDRALRRWLEARHQAFLLAIRSDERLWVVLDTLVPVAGQRWAIEQGFETSKQEIGLDEYEVRTYAARYRFMTLTLYAHAFLAAMRARQTPRKKGRRPARALSRPLPMTWNCSTRLF